MAFNGDTSSTVFNIRRSMEEYHSNLEPKQKGSRRQRIHELLIALIHKQDSLTLMDVENPLSEPQTKSYQDQDPAIWLDRNRRVLKNYQSLVRSAVTLDALLDAEDDGIHT